MSAAVLLLAAGKSERFGKIKALYSYNKKTFIEHSLNKLLINKINEIIVVLGFHAKQISEVLPSTTRTIVNPHPERGQFSSIQVGISEFLRGNQKYLFIQPIDVPIASYEVWHKLLKMSGEKDIIRPVFNEKAGHPVLISKKFCQELLKYNFENANSRLDFIIRENIDRVLDVEVEDKSIILNINTESEMQNYLMCR